MRVEKVEYVDGYKLKILFSDKKTKIIDLENKVKNAKGIFAPLKALEYFKKVALDDSHLSICWPNGADICPDVLYNMGKVVKTAKKASSSLKKSTRLRGKRKQTV